MKTAINQWAFPGDMPASKAITLAKQFGFDAFEVCVDMTGPVPLAASEQDIVAIRRHAEAAGVALTSVASGVGWTLPMTSPDRQVRERGKEAVARSLQIAQWLGVDAVLVVPGAVSSDTPYQAAMENALGAVQDLVPAAEKLGVSIAIENVWNRFLLSPIEMRDFIDQFESPCVGAYFDVGNVVLFGFPEQWIRILGPRIRMVHAKDYRRSVGTIDGFVMLMEGDVSWPAVMAALRETGYDKALVAEYGPYGHSMETMLRHVLASLNTIMSL